MFRTPRGAHSVHLDLVRGIAALLVVLCHLRVFEFVDLSQVDHPGIPLRLFYFVTGLATYAVLLFFVLSGYLVGGSVIQDLQKGRWSWSLYLTKRLTRLWVVLIPALLLTCFWDQLGIRSHGIAPYQGAYFQLVGSGPGGDYDLSFKTFLGNLFFLQTIFAPNFGTDGPVWSLANEFWYYMLFPLMLHLFNGRVEMKARLLMLTFLAVIFWMLPSKMTLLFIVWLTGAGAYLIVHHKDWNRSFNRVSVFVPFLTFLLGLFAICQTGWIDRAAAEFLQAHTQSGWASWVYHKIGMGVIYLIGLAFAGTIPFLVNRSIQNRTYANISKWLSETSYTLYLVHFPLLAFFFFNFRLPDRIRPGSTGYLWFFGYLVLVLVYARGIWYCFERRTGEIRKATLKFLSNLSASFPAR